jgi:antitoxin component HigA of HigAB toxin-antitoxin module
MKPIRTRTDYRAALKEIEALMSARADTPEGKRLDVLATLVEAYERKHFRTPEGLPLRTAVTLPVEMYSEKRIGEFDEAEADLEKVLSRRKKTAR